MALRPVAAALAVILLGGAFALLGPTRSEQTTPAELRASALRLSSGEQVSDKPTSKSARRPAGGTGARLVRRVLLRARPGGRILRPIGPRTEFGSQRVLAVVAQRPGWLAVLTHHVPNSRAAWIPADGAQLLREPYTLDVDLSERSLVVRREGRPLRRISIAIGAAGTATPTGRFAVTDALVFDRAGGPYGCCALALTGRQPNIPQGWNGGDRLALHGTPSERTVGTAVSAGCLRATEADMRWLIANVPLGTRMQIRD